MDRNARDRARDRRDIGRVEFLSDKIAKAREVSSCCLGTERLLEDDAKSIGPNTTKELNHDWPGRD